MNTHQKQETAPLTLFYSYADSAKDEVLLEELEKHLSLLQRQGMIAGWHRHKIVPGDNKNQVSEEQFSSAQIILLLISPDFLVLDTSYTEMERALQRYEDGLAHVIPLLLRPVDCELAPFAHLQALPRNGKPVTKWENCDEAFADIARDVRSAIKQWKKVHVLFLSSARKDLSLINRLKDDLQAHGITGWVNYQAPQSASSDQEEDLREAIRNASAVILVASAYTRRSRLVKQELHIAAMYQRPVYLFWMQGSQLVEVTPAGWSHLPSFDARAERYSQALQDLLQTLGKQTVSLPSQDHASEPSAPPLKAPRNPYKGLKAFSVEDAHDFFGRDRLIEELLEKVQQLLTMDQQDQIASRLLTVLGPSGSGKSSVVMAGLIPKLKQGILSGSQHWIYLDPIVPGKHPIEALALTLAPLFPERGPMGILKDLKDDSARGLHLLLRAYVKQSGVSVLLVIDQFEELFTQTATEDERRQFLDLLLAATSELHGPLVAVLTLRADFYDRPLLYPELGHLIKSHQVIVFPMEMPDLRKVITQPAQLPDVQLTFEEDLVGDLLFEVQGQVGALPLLQFTLYQLFQRREGRLLTRQAYHYIGEVKGALAKQAEKTYKDLPLSTKEPQDLARALFLRLINPGTVMQDATKRRVPRSELVVIDSEETGRLAEVTNAFTEARLLTANVVAGVSTVEVSHDALIQAWIRLQDWLHEARDDIRLQQAISGNAAEWDRHGQPADRLYRGSQLREALRWREANLPSPDEDRFLQASIKERQRYTRRTILIGLAGIMGMVGTGLLANTFDEIIFPPPPSLPKSLPYAYTGHNGSVVSVAWSPDGKRVATGSLDNTVQVWDASSGSLRFTYKGHTNAVKSVAWSPDGKRIASGSDDKTVQVWDASNGYLQFTYKGHTNAVKSVAWSPDNKRIASGSDDKTVQVWDVGSGHLQLSYKGHTDWVNSVVWSPNGKRITSGSGDKTVQVWNASSGSLLLTYTDHTKAVLSVAWSPDGKHIASGSDDNTVQIWNANSGNLLLTYISHTDSVLSVAWSPNGKHITSGSQDKTAQVWDTDIGRLLLTYMDHTDWVNSVAWSPDGKRIVSGSNDKTVHMWDTSNSKLRLLTYARHTEAAESVAWSPDGKRIASSSNDKTVQVWDVSSGDHLLTYTGHTDSVHGVAWSPDGRYITSGSKDNTVHVWDASNGRHLVTYTGHTNIVYRVGWSPDGKYIASGSKDNTVHVWDASNGRPLVIYTGHTNAVFSQPWSPDGKRIVSGSNDKTVHVWDASNGRHLVTYTGHTDSVNDVAWSVDGKSIASASNDRTVQVWDATNGGRLLTYTGHTSAVESVMWSPDGKRIVSGSVDRTVQVWDASSGRHLVTYTGHTNIVWSVAWSPDGKRIASGSQDRVVQVWDASRLK